jgi:cellulose synthase/poly-beta-1,6-N-acetylglucosamine synthase-like glycosyltransferase
MFDNVLYAIIIVGALTLLTQSAVSLYQTFYIWDDPDRLKNASAPDSYEAPHYGFTVLLPARHEGDVIGETLRKLGEAHYPSDKLEFLVLCTADDLTTIHAAEAAIQRHHLNNARVVAFEGEPGKSRAMNYGLETAQHPILTIFDSEDDVSAEIFTIANTIYLRRRVDVLQCGVQLMDYESHWYGTHNVLEYFFWFKSRMHYYARLGSVPLGGNTVFFRKDDLKEVGGWDHECLTEDGDIGIRLSQVNKVFGVMYDAAHVTKEEIPHSLQSFVKQRTRWNQGFLQILRKGDWRKLPFTKQVLLLGYVLTAPSYTAAVIAFAPFLIVIGQLTKLPVLVGLLTFTPMLLAIIMLLLNVVGLSEFGRDQKLHIKFRSYVLLCLTFLPYQVLLMVSAVRAGVRELSGSRGWEKTVHLGTHRTATPVLVSVAASEAA